MLEMLELGKFLNQKFTLEVVIKTMRVSGNHIQEGTKLCFCLSSQKDFTHFASTGKFNLCVNVKKLKHIQRLSRSCQIISI